MKHMLLALASLTIVFIMTSNSGVVVNSFYSSHLAPVPVAQLDANTIRTNGTNCAKTIIHLAVSPDSSFLATSDDISTSIELWDMNTYKIIKTIPVLGEHVTDITFSPDSQLLVWASSVGGIGIPYGNGSIELYDLSTNAIKATLNDVADVVTELNMFDNKTTISFIGSQYGDLRANVQIWDAISQTNIVRREAWDIAPAFSAFTLTSFLGTKLSLGITNEFSYQIEEWNGQTNQVLREAKVEYPISILAINHKGSMLALADDKGNISLWDTTMLVPLSTFQPQQSEIEHLIFIDENRLMSIGKDNNEENIQIWNTKPQPQLFAQKKFDQEITGEFALAPDGKQIVLANAKEEPYGVTLWNYENDVTSFVNLDC